MLVDVWSQRLSRNTNYQHMVPVKTHIQKLSLQVFSALFTLDSEIGKVTPAGVELIDRLHSRVPFQ